MDSLLEFVTKAFPGADTAFVRWLMEALRGEEGLAINIADHEPVTQQEILELARSLWSVYESTDLGNFPKSHVPAAPVAIAWWRATFRQAEAAVRLVDAGLSDAAVPNPRAAFEDSVYLSTLAQSTDRGCVNEFLDARMVEYVRTSRLGLKKYDSKDSVPANMAKVLDGLSSVAVQKGFDWVNSFEGVCNWLDGGGPLLYTVYRFISGAIHPGFGPAALYLTIPIDDASPMQPSAHYTPDTLITATSAAVWATQALDHLLGTDITPRLDAIADRLNLKPLFLVP